MYIHLDRDGSLYKLLRGFLDAYNHRTDVMEASTDVALQKQIDALTADLRASNTELQTAVDENKETK